MENSRIIIKEIRSAFTIADTVIKEFDWKSNVAFINASSLTRNYFGEVYVLIFQGKSLCEYKGRLEAAIVANEVAVKLYKRREKEDRKSGRYEFETKGKITQLKFGDIPVILRKPIEMKTINISSNGILLESISDSLAISNQIMFEMIIDVGNTSIECEVVRMQNETLRTVEYGCRILSISETR